MRSITVGLAAVGVVCLINGARKFLGSHFADEASAVERAEAGACPPLETESAS